MDIDLMAESESDSDDSNHGMILIRKYCGENFEDSCS